MREKKRALGKGLSALLQNSNTKNKNDNQFSYDDKSLGSFKEIEINQIEVNPFQPRSSNIYPINLINC